MEAREQTPLEEGTTTEMPVTGSPTAIHDFRAFLQGELIRRCRQNPNYSMRSFSKFLRVDNSWLSKIMRGKRVLSLESIDRIGQRLGLSPKRIESFKKNKINESAQTATEKFKPSFTKLTQDSFEVIAEWYHFAILELMKIKGFEQDPKWLSRKLGISYAEAQSAVERLMRINILSVDSDGLWIDNSKGFTSQNMGINYSSYAHRKFQEAVLAKSLDALKSLPIEYRDHSCMMMATSQNKLNEAKQMIDEFRYSLCQFLEDCEEKDAVFQLAVSLFPLTEIKK